jgi:quinohemoprotein ethanol dehydrogenase
VRLSLAALILSVCLPALLTGAQTVVDGAAIADETQGANWLSSGRTYSEQHYSPLADINTANVGRLGLAWSLDLPGQRTLEAPPLAVDGVLFFSGTSGRTFAVNARTGRPLWEFDPDLAHHSPEKLRMVMGACLHWMQKQGGPFGARKHLTIRTLGKHSPAPRGCSTAR